jgi:hypothetical protein
VYLALPNKGILKVDSNALMKYTVLSETFGGAVKDYRDSLQCYKDMLMGGTGLLDDWHTPKYY